MKYSGRWHTEGQTENIVAVSVYYIHVDEQLEGGALKFRPPETPQYTYDIETGYEVNVGTGAAIVFHNSTPHRFRQIRNLTKADNRRRTFINFFIVDPSKPILLRNPTIAMISAETAKKLLIECSQRVLKNGRQLDELVIVKILSYLLEIWVGDQGAKEFRHQVRQAMLEERSGWGWICWGDCGTTEFVKSLSVWGPRKRDETTDLHHTESD